MSEHSLSTKVTPNTTYTPTYLQKFIVHFASKMFGYDVLLKQLELASTSTTTSTSSPPFQLYWRTPLLCNVDSTISLSSSSSSSSSVKWKTIFVDITFDFSFIPIEQGNTTISSGDNNTTSKNTSDIQQQQQQQTIRVIKKYQPSITVKGGVLIQSTMIPQPKGIYVHEKLSSLFTIPQLQKHVEQLGIDFDLDNPEPLAMSMAEAFLSLNDTQSHKEPIQVVGVSKGKDNKNTATTSSSSLVLKEICIPMYYKELDEITYMRIESNDSTVSEIDPGAMDMFIRNLTLSSSKHHDTTTTKTNSAEVMSALDKWCQHQAQQPFPTNDSVINGHNVSPNHQEATGITCKQLLSPTRKVSSTQQQVQHSSNDKEITTITKADETVQHQNMISASAAESQRNDKVEEKTTTSTNTQITTSNNNRMNPTKTTKARSAPATTGYVVLHRAAPSKRRKKRGKPTYSKMK